MAISADPLDEACWHLKRTGSGSKHAPTDTISATVRDYKDNLDIRGPVKVLASLRIEDLVSKGSFEDLSIILEIRYRLPHTKIS